MIIKKYFLLLLVTTLGMARLNAQVVKTNPWDKWQFLIGDWEGKGTGKPGDGVGGFSLKPDLDGKVLVRKSHADYPAANGRAAFSHNDLMIVYPGENAPTAIYFDNEGHVINYAVTYDDITGSIILLSIATEGPRFKLTYIPVDKTHVNIKFEMAPPNKPAAFSTYIEASAVRK